MNEPAEHYTVQSWKGIEMLQCIVCPFNTLEGQATMVSHLVSAHFRPANPAATSFLPVATKFGGVIEPGMPLEQVVETEAELLSEGIDVSELTTEQILELVEKGELEAELVIKSEKAGKRRKSLLQRLGAKE